MLQHRGIQSFSSFEKSIKNFADFYPRIKGASDIDFFYERNDKFLILEDKEIINNELKMYYGEIKAIKSFVDLSGKVQGYIVTHEDEIYKMISFDEILMKNFKKYNGIWMQYFDVSKYLTMTKQEMIETVGKICDSFETLKKVQKRGKTC